MNKRGQTEGISKIFIMGVGICIAFVIFVLVLSFIGQVVTTQQYAVGNSASNFYTLKTVNESQSGNFTLNAGGCGDNPYNCNNVDNTSAIVQNGSRTFTRNTDFNLTQQGVFMWIPGATVYGTQAVNVTYNTTAFVFSTAYNASASGLAGTTSIGGLIPTMGIIFGIVLVLSILMVLATVFGFQYFKKE